MSQPRDPASPVSVQAGEDEVEPVHGITPMRCGVVPRGRNVTRVVPDVPRGLRRRSELEVQRGA